VPGRYFHFAFEFGDETPIAALTSDLVTSLLRHAGLSLDHANETTATVLAAIRGGGAGPCRVQLDAGVDLVQIRVTHAGVDTWRGTCDVE